MDASISRLLNRRISRALRQILSAESCSSYEGWCCGQGKSTLCNHLLGRERSLTGPEPGLTRDAVEEEFEWQGHSVELVDSAGWVKAAKLPEDGAR